MPLYAEIQNSDDSILRFKNTDTVIDIGSLSHKFGADKASRIVPVNRLADPVIDEATQRLGSDSYTVLPDEVQAQRTVIAKSQAEQDRETEITQAKAAYASLMDDSATSTQVKRILARVVREVFGD